MSHYTDCVDWLLGEFHQRRARNQLFSLRSFARLLALPPGPLSEILSRKRPLSVRVGERIARRLAFSPAERSKFIKLIKERSQSKADSRWHNERFRELSEDEFQLVADWYHYALLSLMETNRFREDVRWIAGRLGISVVEARLALQRLERLGIIERKEGQLQINDCVSTTQDIPSEALRSAHRQDINHALRSLDEDSIDDRDITAITMAIDVSKIPVAKKLIKKFRRDLAAVLEQGNRTEVYNLNIQLIPLTKKETEDG